MMAPSPDYSSKVAEYFAHPANAGIPAGDPAALSRGEAGERAHGVQVVFHMRAEGERVEEIRFQAFGCPHTIAACSMVTERLSGGPVEALNEFDPQVLVSALEVPIEKVGRMLVVQDALRNCFIDWENRRR
jgi:nitrogen fixation NifU-like protein